MWKSGRASCAETVSLVEGFLRGEDTGRRDGARGDDLRPDRQRDGDVPRS
jgi:hypothetical protein